MSPFADRLRALGLALRRHEAFWRPPVFHDARPPWRLEHPELAADLLALNDTVLSNLLGDNAALHAWMLMRMPAWRECLDLAHVPLPSTSVAPETGSAGWHIPGGKRAQIDAFAAATGAPRAPVLEWCAGKGHLGRHYARRWGVTVTSLEWDSTLCAEGRTLAKTAGVEQDFVVGDVLASVSACHLDGRHVVALHACGDLHRSLLRAAPGRAVALDLAPCCYYRSREARYTPFNPEADLPLSRDELHLPVTDTATAGARDRRLRDESMARKLGYLAWFADHTGKPRPPGLKPVPSAWNRLPFADYIQCMAGRDGLAADTGASLASYSDEGWRRQREVMRLNLARLAFRRPLEVWLALDQALHLERAGYRATLTTFCPPTLTPRNLLVSARA